MALVRAFDWQILTPDGAPALSSSGLQVVPHAPLSALKSCDYLFVVASYDHLRHDTATTRRGLQRAARLARSTVGLDAGPWLMASSGLLDGRRATVHWDLLDAFTERFLGVDAEHARVVRDGSMMTCAGAMSALDLTLGLISDHLGVSARLDVEALFIHGDPPVGAARDQKAVSDPLVSRALSAMRENLEVPLTLNKLARHLSCQPRTLDRRFRASLGAPTRYGLPAFAPVAGAQNAGKHQPWRCRDRRALRLRIPRLDDACHWPVVWHHPFGPARKEVGQVYGSALWAFMSCAPLHIRPAHRPRARDRCLRGGVPPPFCRCSP